MTDKKDFGLPSLEEIMRRANQSGQKDVKPSLDTKVEVVKPISKSSSDLKSGLLHVQLTDEYRFCGYYALKGNYSDGDNHYFNHHEVQIINHQTCEILFLSTDSLKWPIKEEYKKSVYRCGYDPGVCQKVLPGGNYTVKATVGGETVSRNITVDGDAKVLLQFKKK